MVFKILHFVKMLCANKTLTTITSKMFYLSQNHQKFPALSEL